jgi:hypothetical protein
MSTVERRWLVRVLEKALRDEERATAPITPAGATPTSISIDLKRRFWRDTVCRRAQRCVG